ncbi:MAG: tppB [Gammaproteobacteria bacterium]|jgi:POT family proton-dependent oligopeptide transporter|nr:tppB [Gammaproteobacteria bacterium]
MLGFIDSFKQPKPFYMIFFIEAWERFGFYGMQAILVLYMIKNFNITDADSFNIYSAFTALLYSLTSVGGYIGDNILGTKRTMVLGSFILTLGYFLLSLEKSGLFYYALGVIVVGNGLFKANPSSLLSKCYDSNDHRIDGAFTLYYMAINIGSFFSMLFVPVIAQKYGWGLGFRTCSIGLVIAILNYFLCYKWVKNISSSAGSRPMSLKNLLIVMLGALGVVFISAWILQRLAVAHWLLFIIGCAVVVKFVYEIFKSSGIERSKMIVAFVLILQAIVWWVMYQQMPTSLNFFAINNVEHSILGITINPLSFQALNPFWILVASPILASVYNHFAKDGRDLSMPKKFALGMFLSSLGFLILVLSKHYADANGIVSSWWLIVSYFFQSVGELLVSALGLAMVARLVPQRLMGFIMGAWFMTTAAAMVVGGFVASWTSVPSNMNIPTETLPVYTHVFLELGSVTFVISLLMMMLAPKLTRMMS